MKKTIAIILLVILVFMSISCKKEETQYAKTTDNNDDYFIEVNGRVIRSPKGRIYDEKERSEQNGYEYKLNDFSYTYEYDDLPTLKIERFFDYDEEEDTVSYMKKLYEKTLNPLPDNIKSAIKDSGITIYFVLDIYAYFGSHEAKDLNGFYRSATNEIYIACGSEMKRELAWLHVIWHELGHNLDHYYGTLSNTKEFKAIYDDEFNEDLISNATHNPAEWFADIFSLYMSALTTEYDVIKRKSLNEKIPETYKFLMEKLSLPEV